MPEFIFEVYCEKCGAGLCNNTTVSGGDIYVEPCDNCLSDARSEGYSEGYEVAENRCDEGGSND